MGKKIVICDDHILFLGGITEILKKFGHDYSIFPFGNSELCRNYIQQNSIDVFICDLNINGFDGFVLLEELKNELQQAKSIILTAYFEDFLIQKAEKMGVNAFLKKETTAEELVEVIEMDNAAAFYINKNHKKITHNYTSLDGNIVNKFRLSKQEKEIIKLIIEGKTSKEIADLLYISKSTVDTHRKNINRKLEISNCGSLIKFAHENNIFS
ncbi:response regulator [Flavobacterium taihuense]|uniref:Response regulator transcription factor n=1 Tax=Flavobacterium taihuense TaxID=2857508 RepID=A0ABS6Y1J0_9FLAO|nr:response regulator transcription factor [Flavobacterium taihuense]MBW4362739.1 response regulator transcription factor [Flavobacterium taihuense]